MALSLSFYFTSTYGPCLASLSPRRLKKELPISCKNLEPRVLILGSMLGLCSPQYVLEAHATAPAVLSLFHQPCPRVGVPLVQLNAPNVRFKSDNKYEQEKSKGRSSMHLELRNYQEPTRNQSQQHLAYAFHSAVIRKQAYAGPSRHTHHITTYVVKPI